MGSEKLFVLNTSITQFLDTFAKIKNVDFRETEGLDELSRLHVDEHDFVEMKALVNFAGSLAGGAVARTVGGALAAFGAYSAAQTLACASTGTAASKNLERARTNKAEAIQIASQLATASLQCEAIRRRTCMFYNLLAQLDACFLPLIYKMEDIVNSEGDDYRFYSDASKKTIASCVSVAVSVKSVLDTPLLTDDGLLTEESEARASSIEGFLKNMRIPY